jgi:hypothetical protein
MTSQGTGHRRFQRASKRRHLRAAEMAARELGRAQPWPKHRGSGPSIGALSSGYGARWPWGGQFACGEAQVLTVRWRQTEPERGRVSPRSVVRPPGELVRRSNRQRRPTGPEGRLRLCYGRVDDKTVGSALETSTRTGRRSSSSSPRTPSSTRSRRPASSSVGGSRPSFTTCANRSRATEADRENPVPCGPLTRGPRSCSARTGSRSTTLDRYGHPLPAARHTSTYAAASPAKC